MGGMNLVADEGVERHIVDRLRQDGHVVRYIAELTPGIDDEQVLEGAISSGAVLVTTDKDFGELVFRLRRASAGVILLRLAGLPNSLKADIVTSTLRQYEAEMEGSFSVIEPGNVRIRKRPG